MVLNKENKKIKKNFAEIKYRRTFASEKWQSGRMRWS